MILDIHVMAGLRAGHPFVPRLVVAGRVALRSAARRSLPGHDRF